MEKLQTLRKSERRAVAPIIATLLMVAIAVVGGILIFVFTQGFFEDSSISSSPTNDTFKVVGYDARDKADLENALGDEDDCDACGEDQTGSLKDGDIALIYIRNTGEANMTLERVKVFGLEYALDNDAATCTDTTTDEFAIFDDDCAASTAGQIAPNATVVLAFAYHGDSADGGTNDVKIGRAIPVTLVSGAGTPVSAKLISGTLKSTLG